MPKSYSCDLRERLIELVEAGASRHEAAEHFGVSVSSVIKWMQRWNESRSATPKPRGGSVSPLEYQAERVVAVITDQPDLTLEETAAELRRYRIRPAAARCRAFFSGTTSPLKKACKLPSESVQMWPRARRRWIREQGLLDPAKLVFLDETAVTTTMVRLRGRAPRGTRVIGVGFRLEREDNHLHSSNAARQNDCADGIRSSSSDNCRPHTSPRVRKVIEKARATLRYLPKYSFDLNPIEMAYSKFKEFLRSVEARTVPAIYRAIRLFLPSLSAEECANYLRHAGDVSI